MSKPSAHLRRRRPSFFHPVPLRRRVDGWSEERQCAFLAQLYITGSVSAAARAVGMARHSAYRLRACAGADSFAAAWDRVLTPPGSGRVQRPQTDWRKVTGEALLWRMESGLVQPVVFRGQMVGIRRKADNSALLRLLRRSNSVARRFGGSGRT